MSVRSLVYVSFKLYSFFSVGQCSVVSISGSIDNSVKLFVIGTKDKLFVTQKFICFHSERHKAKSVLVLALAEVCSLVFK